MMTTTPTAIREGRTASHNQQASNSNHSQQCATEHDLLSFLFELALNLSQGHGTSTNAEPVPNAKIHSSLQFEPTIEPHRLHSVELTAQSQIALFSGLNLM
jgi:hypothetical protein